MTANNDSAELEALFDGAGDGIHLLHGVLGALVDGLQGS